MSLITFGLVEQLFSWNSLHAKALIPLNLTINHKQITEENEGERH